ncbi:cell division protein FtsQ/DivIB [Pelagovum pacificum]|uniref:Cell division protein FtsQ n=1 Tax=Pelagovum pacificum TaxID=2588711 RepID=A0A5C5G9Q8_9RHOB|nr:cell division protein FtsQ/DivIB [Pelagovum pacificum]QQA41838.1 cell division protein FtsQ [Pelagovum pacificum]TNY30718.1 cell division protein FtsQ [Pelagovum pacificum]
MRSVRRRAAAASVANRRETTRRDPAPSRWRYRYNRLMLSPGFTRFLRTGVPLILVSAISAIWVSQPANRELLMEKYAEVRDDFRNRPEFMVGSLAVKGADADLARQIGEVVQLEFPISSFELDLEGLRETVSAVNAVESARLQVRSGGILEVEVVQREPVAVWRAQDGLKLVDDTGAFIAPLEARADRPDLPLIVGDGARDALDEALALYAAARPLGEDMRGLVRMGERRWDVVLAGDQRVLLPSDGAVQALERVIALHEAKDLFGRDISAVDMRNAERPTLRLNPPAMAALRRTSETDGD